MAMDRSLITLAVMALCVVTLGFVSVARHSGRSELLVGSSTVDPHKPPLVTPGIGNQAAGQNHFDVGTNIVFHGVHNEGGVIAAKKTHPVTRKHIVGSAVIPPPMPNHPKAKPPVFTNGNQAAISGSAQGFYNTARRTLAPAAPKKGLVGSTTVGRHDLNKQTPGIGNEAAGQSHFDVGTNIVFHGVHNEGGVIAAKKAHPASGRKSLVGSRVIPPPKPDHPVAKPPVFTNGNQAAVSGGSHGFYNTARRTKIF